MIKAPIFYPANKRGYSKNEWLESYFSFSFANYYNPQNIHFGALRVLNDDIIDPLYGFGMHPHDNMEIITINLSGALQHRDNLGNTEIIGAEEIQVMSAGTGIMHSETNPSDKESAKILQLWIFPNQKNVHPKYQQKKISLEERKNKFKLIVSPIESQSNLWIHQDAWLYLSHWDEGFSQQYELQKKSNALYIFVIEGTLKVNNFILQKRDAIGMQENTIFVEALSENTQFLLIDLPLTF